MNDLASWLAEHATTVIALVASLRAIWRAKALRDEAAARAVDAVVDELASAKKRHAECEAQLEQLENRVEDAEGISRALDRELKTLMREIHASGKD